MKKISVILLLCLCLVLSIAVPAMADYDYSITLYAGNQGSFVSSPIASVQRNGALLNLDSDLTTTLTADEFTVKGLRYGDVVRFNVQDGSVSMDTGSKYYVRGLRLSGRDNNSNSYTAYTVTEDQMFVVSYGVKGNMVKYTVNYQTKDGGVLAPSVERYGELGEKPVEAYTFIEGYEPQAYNLTRTLVEDESQNVFTFYYTAVEKPAQTITETETVYETRYVTENTNGTTGTTTNTSTRTTAAVEATATPTPVFTPGPENETETEVATETTTETETEEYTGPAEIIDLDDPEIPLASAAPAELPGGMTTEADSTSQGLSSYFVWLVVGLALVALLVTLIVIDKRQKKQNMVNDDA